jgi:hypothetical protein
LWKRRVNSQKKNPIAAANPIKHRAKMNSCGGGSMTVKDPVRECPGRLAVLGRRWPTGAGMRLAGGPAGADRIRNVLMLGEPPERGGALAAGVTYKKERPIGGPLSHARLMPGAEGM